MVFRVVSQKVIHVGEERVQENKVSEFSGQEMLRWSAATTSECGEMETVLQPEYGIYGGSNSDKYMVK